MANLPAFFSNSTAPAKPQPNLTKELAAKNHELEKGQKQLNRMETQLEKTLGALDNTKGSLLTTAEVTGASALSAFAGGYVGKERLTYGGVDARTVIGGVAVITGVVKLLMGQDDGIHYLNGGTGVVTPVLLDAAESAGRDLAARKNPAPTVVLQALPAGPTPALKGEEPMVRVPYDTLLPFPQPGQFNGYAPGQMANFGGGPGHPHYQPGPQNPQNFRGFMQGDPQATFQGQGYGPQPGFVGQGYGPQPGFQGQGYGPQQGFQGQGYGPQPGFGAQGYAHQQGFQGQGYAPHQGFQGQGYAPQQGFQGHGYGPQHGHPGAVPGHLQGAPGHYPMPPVGLSVDATPYGHNVGVSADVPQVKREVTLSPPADAARVAGGRNERQERYFDVSVIPDRL